jgi:hypothetical protein
MTSEYGTIEINWQPVMKPDGSQVVSKDGTPIVESLPMVLTPKLQGEYGGWAFEDLDGFWTYRGAVTDIVQGVESEVVLSLGGHKQNGTRYQNINRIKATGMSTAPGQQQQGSFQSSNAPAPTAPLSGDGRNESIREQAFFNNLNPEILAQLPAEQQEALLVAYFDTGMLMLRDSVRKRALAKMNESNELGIEVPDTPMVNAAIQAGGVVTSVESATPAEDVQQLPW